MIINKKNMKKEIKKFRQSSQRDRILEVLGNTKSHPTADWIYSRMKEEFPKLSPGTVYRNLGILEEMGKVKRIHYGSTFDRYEISSGHHYHLICRECDSITDIEIPACKDLLKRAAERSDFKITDHQIEFYGKCNACNSEESLY